MLTLTPGELAELTARRQPAAQIRWLDKHQWLYAIGGDGLPKVARAHFEQRLVSGEPSEPGSSSSPLNRSAPEPERVWRVNTAALLPQGDIPQP